MLSPALTQCVSTSCRALVAASVVPPRPAGALVAESVTYLLFSFIITSELLYAAIFPTSAMAENLILLQWL